MAQKQCKNKLHILGHTQVTNGSNEAFDPKLFFFFLQLSFVNFTRCHGVGYSPSFFSRGLALWLFVISSWLRSRSKYGLLAYSNPAATMTRPPLKAIMRKVNKGIDLKKERKKN